MIKNLQKKHYYLIGGWLIINLLQALFTGLHSDESYYWMYSQDLAWGYFDHPPMAAFFIHAGYALLPGELGVRLLLILLSTFTLALIVNELNEQKEFFFLSVFVLSFPLIHTHIAGFLAIPDVPLLFFTMLFLLLYRKFLEKPDIKIAILLSLVTAAMIYSKYHAFLILGLTVLSNLKLLRNKFFWLTAGIAMLLLIPHVWWQIDNEFPTFKYHLIDRAKPLRIKHITDYLLNQLLMAGPLTGVLVLWKFTRFRISNKFERALVFNIIGFYGIFFLLSFRNRIEAHWTAAIMPMLILITYPLIKNDARIKFWFKRLALPIIVLMLLYRIYLAVDAIPNVGHTKITFYQREASALEIKEMAKGKKVGFFNNYAAVSNYIFYTGDSAVHLSTPGYRFSQYDLWNDEQYAHRDPVFAIQSKHLDPPNLTRMATGEMKGYIVIEEFQALTGLEIHPEIIKQPDGHFSFEIILHNTTQRKILTEHVSEPVLATMQNNVEIVAVPFYKSDKSEIAPGEKATLDFILNADKLRAQEPLVIYTRSKENIRGELKIIELE